MKNSVRTLAKEGYKGGDVSLAISLFEYGLAWLKTEESITFIHRCATNDRQFCMSSYALPLDVQREWNWADFTAIASFCGSTKEAWLSAPLEIQVADLLNFYGVGNVFGMDGRGSFTISE